MKWLRCQYIIGPRELNFEKKLRPDILGYFCPYKLQKRRSRGPFFRNLEEFSIIKATSRYQRGYFYQIQENYTGYQQIWSKKGKTSHLLTAFGEKGQYQRKIGIKNYPSCVKLFFTESDIRDQTKTTQPFVIQLGLQL